MILLNVKKENFQLILCVTTCFELTQNFLILLLLVLRGQMGS